MDREQDFIAKLHESLDSFEAERSLAENEIAHSRQMARLATKIWAKGDKDLAAAAFSFLLQVEDIALVPVLEGPVRDEPRAVSQVMRLLTTVESSLRRRIVERIDPWLDDKRPVAQPPKVLPIEGTVRERRVCDEAYVAMRRLVHFGESELAQMVDEDQLYDLDESQRDAAIARARASNTWQRVVDPDHVIDD